MRLGNNHYSRHNRGKDSSSNSLLDTDGLHSPVIRLGINLPYSHQGTTYCAGHWYKTKSAINTSCQWHSLLFVYPRLFGTLALCLILYKAICHGIRRGLP
jgi:hypothetical protein